MNDRALRRSAAAVLDRLGARIDPGAQLTALSIAERRLVADRPRPRDQRAAARARRADGVADRARRSATCTRCVRTLRDARRGRSSTSRTGFRRSSTSPTTSPCMRDGRMVVRVADREVDTQRADRAHHGRERGRAVAALATAAGGDRARRAAARRRADGLPGVVEDASFVLHAGDVLGIAGLVGAGRTELVRLIFGADRAASGQVLVRGRPVRIRGPRDAMRRGTRAAAGGPPQPGHRPHLLGAQEHHARDDAALPAQPAASRAEPSAGDPRRAPADRASRDQGRQPRASDPVTSRAATSRRWCWRSGSSRTRDVFIFDEPTHGIDVGAKAEIYRLMTGLAAAGQGVIFISSEFPELVGIVQPGARDAGGAAGGRVRGRRDHRERADRPLLCRLSGGGCRLVRRPNQPNACCVALTGLQEKAIDRSTKRLIGIHGRRRSMTKRVFAKPVLLAGVLLLTVAGAAPGPAAPPHPPASRPSPGRSTRRGSARRT